MPAILACHAQSAPMNDKPANDSLRGILMMVLAVGAFALMDAQLKLLTPHYSALQIAALRGYASLPVVLLSALLIGRRARLFQIRWSLHLVRGVLGIVMLASFAYGLRTLPMSEAYAIFFIAPLLITALAAPLLGERVGANRWLAILIGGIGVLVILRPSGAGLLSLAGVAVLVSALAYALGAISARVLGRTDSSVSMVFWMMLLMALGATALTGSDWRPLQSQHGWILLGIAVFGSIGQFAITDAFKRGQASLIAPFEYTALAWGLGLDWLLWQALPDRIVLLGAAIVVASGLYLLWSERRRQR
jgi:drug/metabolite transporter (DMT)-like permease